MPHSTLSPLQGTITYNTVILSSEKTASDKSPVNCKAEHYLE